MRRGLHLLARCQAELAVECDIDLVARHHQCRYVTRRHQLHVPTISSLPHRTERMHLSSQPKLQPRLFADVRSLLTLGPPLTAGLYTSALGSSAGNGEPAVSEWTGPRFASTFEASAAPGWLRWSSWPGYGSNGWDSGAERREVTLRATSGRRCTAVRYRQ